MMSNSGGHGRAPIAAIIVARNEAEILGPCLASVAALVDEIIVVDLESEDATRAVATGYGATVVSHAPVAYADPVRGYGISRSTAEWVLLLDPDERIRPALAAEIRRVVDEDRYDVVLLPYINTAFGRELHSPGAVEFAHPRLFRRGTVKWPATIHTAPVLSGLRCHFIPPDPRDPYARVVAHVPWRTPHQVLEKFSRYVRDEAARRDAKGARFSLGRMLYRLGREFGGRYVAGRCYEDGLPGFFYASMYTVYELGVQMELWQLQGSSTRGDRIVQVSGRLLGQPFRWLFPLRMWMRRRAKAASGEVRQ